jgi:hypothetical protein
VATAPRNAIPFPGTKRTYSNSGLKDIEQNDGNLMSKKVKKNQDVQNKGRHGDTDSEDRCRHDEQPTHMKVKKKQDGQKKRRHADADADSEDSDCHDEQPTQKKAKNIHHANDRAMPKQPMIFATPPKQIINDTTGDEVSSVSFTAF